MLGNFTKVSSKMLNQTTVKMLERRGVAAIRFDEGEKVFWEFSQIVDGEPADEFGALYCERPTGLFYAGTCYANSEEFPHWISSNEFLRSFIDEFVFEIVIATIKKIYR